MNKELIMKENKMFIVKYFRKGSKNESQESFHVSWGRSPEEIYYLAKNFGDEIKKESGRDYSILNSHNIEIKD